MLKAIILNKVSLFPRISQSLMDYLRLHNIVNNIAKKESIMHTSDKLIGNGIMGTYNIDAKIIACYFLSKVDEEAGDCISNLKLQKLLYYAQGFVLALTDKKLFENNIRAWQHGPVIQDVYEVYSQYKAQCIPKPTEIDLSAINRNLRVKEILDDVYDVYGQFSAWKLRNMTHDEKPWLETAQNEIISVDLMREFFKTKIR